LASDHPRIALEKIASEVIVCPLCDLARSRTKAVPGDGNPEARVMLVGEGPGWHEDQQGLPFVGAAGKFLNELLAIAGLERKDVFITNIVKCRPPGNRDPLPDEIHACNPYLEGQISAIKPDVIVTLGRHSMSHWFPGERISKIHGSTRKNGERTIVPMYHPAAGLHQSSLRGTIEEDFAKLPKILAEVERGRLKSEQPAADESPSSQMKMF